MIWRKIIFLQITDDLNIEFSFTQACFLTKNKEPSLPYNWAISDKELCGIYVYFKSISANWNGETLRY